MTMPTFLIIGATKSGTTALTYYLKQHPQIYISPIKEPRFFALEGESINFGDRGNWKKECITDIETYQSLFNKVSNEIAIGESSTWYLCQPKAPERIHHYIPDVKLIAILRDPVERAYSNFLYMKSNNDEPLTDFVQAMQMESERVQKNWSPRTHYQRRGLYYTQLKSYFDLFDREQIKIYLYEDLKKDSLALVQDIFGFLNVDNTFIPDTAKKHNVTYLPKNQSFHQVLTSNSIATIARSLLPLNLRKNIKEQFLHLNREKTYHLKPEVRQQYIEEFREEIMNLQDLIERDLSKWLEVY